VEGDFGSGWRRRFGDAGASEAHALVEAFEFGALVDEAEFHLSKAGGPATGFGGGHEFAAQALALASRLDRDEAEVGLRCSGLNEDAGEDLAVVFSQEESAARPHFPHRVGVDALSFDEGAFGDECAVDQADDGVDVGDLGSAEGESGHGDILGLWRGVGFSALGSRFKPLSADIFFQSSQ